jgi:NADH:ubiquinone oxidoreductase subunit 2 (subunit N)
MNTVSGTEAVAGSAIFLYYYAQVLNDIYSAEPAAGYMPVRPPWAAMLSIAALAGIVIAFACASGRLPGRLSIVQNSSD